MSKEMCPCGMSIECKYVVTRKDGTKFCVQDMNCFTSNRWLVEHDSELLDKVAERINSLKYDTCDAVTRRIEHQLKAEVFEVINELKVGVLNGK